MRVTNQMTSQIALKSGIPLQQNNLLNILTNQEQSDDNSLLSSIGTSKNGISALQKLNHKDNEKLHSYGTSLSEFASKLNESGEGSLYEKAKESNSTEEIVSNVQKMVDAYNNTLDLLKNSEGDLNRFYMEELRSYVTEHQDALKAAGVTAKSDGKLSVNEETLKKADLETLEAAFGSESGFTDKVGYVAGRVAENAEADNYTYLNQYNETGLSNWENYAANHYNFWG